MTLTIRDLQVAYDDVPAVRGVSLTVPDGQVLAVLGQSHVRADLHSRGPRRTRRRTMC